MDAVIHVGQLQLATWSSRPDQRRPGRRWRPGRRAGGGVRPSRAARADPAVERVGGRDSWIAGSRSCRFRAGRTGQPGDERAVQVLCLGPGEQQAERLPVVVDQDADGVPGAFQQAEREPSLLVLAGLEPQQVAMREDDSSRPGRRRRSADSSTTSGARRCRRASADCRSDASASGRRSPRTRPRDVLESCDRAMLRLLAAVGPTSQGLRRPAESGHRDQPPSPAGG